MTGWLIPVVLCASLLFLGWSFYNIYVRKMASRTTAIISWLSLAFILALWTWNLSRGVLPWGNG